MRTLTKKDIRVPKRATKSHKGDHGRVLVIGGSEDYVGAVALAGIAALRSGADLVVVAAPDKVAWAVNSLYPDLITKKLPGKTLTLRHWPTIRTLASKFDVILIGNGIGLDWRTQNLVNKIITLPNKKVLDADALKLVDRKNIQNAIITPHTAELVLFSGMSHPDPLHVQQHLRSWLSYNILIWKGPVDYIMNSKQLVSNKTGNPGMTKGGTGDVLAGLVAGFYAQQDAWQSACNAIFISGKIGDILKKKHKGYSYLASDMVNEIEKVLE